MKSVGKLLVTALLFSATLGTSFALADDVEQQTFLYGVYAGCIHTLDTDPRTASAPQGKKQILCGCETNYIKANNIRTQEQMEAAQQGMGNAMAGCIQSSTAQ